MEDGNLLVIDLMQCQHNYTPFLITTISISSCNNILSSQYIIYLPILSKKFILFFSHPDRSISFCFYLKASTCVFMIFLEKLPFFVQNHHNMMRKDLILSSSKKDQMFSICLKAFCFFFFLLVILNHPTMNCMRCNTYE